MCYIQEICWRTQSEIQQIDAMQSEHISFQLHNVLWSQQGRNIPTVLLDWLITSTAAAAIESDMMNCWTRLQISGALGRKASDSSRLKMLLMTPGKAPSQACFQSNSQLLEKLCPNKQINKEYFLWLPLYACISGWLCITCLVTILYTACNTLKPYRET